MDRLEAVTVKFTTEEIVVLLRELGIENHEGLDSSALDSLSERERELVLDVARRGLIARQIMAPDGSGGWDISQFAIASLGVSLAPTRSILVTTGRSRDDADAYLFHTAQDVYTNHEISDDGTHQFLVMVDGQTWHRSILSAAGVNDDMPAVAPPFGEAVNVPASRLNRAHELAQKNTQEAVDQLVGAGVSESAAAQLAGDLGQGMRFSTITNIEYGADSSQENISFVLGQDHCWRLSSTREADQDPMIGLTPVAADSVRQQIASFIA